MGVWEFFLIILLCVLLLKPEDIKNLTTNISTFITNINKYMNLIKNNIIRSFDTDK